MSDAINDNGSFPAAVPVPPDPHGAAALLLVESLIHGLVARSGLSTSEAIEIVQIAIEVQNDTSDDRGDIESASTTLLSRIASSLGIDDDNPPDEDHER